MTTVVTTVPIRNNPTLLVQRLAIRTGWRCQARTRSIRSSAAAAVKKTSWYRISNSSVIECGFSVAGSELQIGGSCQIDADYAWPRFVCAGQAFDLHRGNLGRKFDASICA